MPNKELCLYLLGWAKSCSILDGRGGMQRMGRSTRGHHEGDKWWEFNCDRLAKSGWSWDQLWVASM